MGIYFVGCSIHVDKKQKNGLETVFLVLLYFFCLLINLLFIIIYNVFV